MGYFSNSFFENDVVSIVKVQEAVRESGEHFYCFSHNLREKRKEWYQRCILILALRERNFKGAGLQNFIFPVSQGKTPYP